MTKFNGRVCTQYKKLPLINPDLIYLDGPDQFNVKKNVNGISTNLGCMMQIVDVQSCTLCVFGTADCPECLYQPGLALFATGRPTGCQAFSRIDYSLELRC